VNSPRIIVVGGGAAGIFAAITAAESGATVTVLEQSSHFLSKVRISGGGRCNVTHACFDPTELTEFYPRGGPALMGLFHAFGVSDTIDWFEARGVQLTTESDGRMFPVSDTSETIVDCLLHAARAADVHLRLNCGVTRARRVAPGRFLVSCSDGTELGCDRLLLATGGCRGADSGRLPASLGHSLEPPAPSLFTFTIDSDWLRALAGTTVPGAMVTVPSFGLREHGPLLITHWGLSGPAVLRLSAWGARKLHACDYHFPIQINWLTSLTDTRLNEVFDLRRQREGAKLVTQTPIAPLTSRLWRALVLAAGVGPQTRWASLTQTQRHHLIQQLTRAEFAVVGRSLNKDEFVTCGGVRLGEVNLKTMESRQQPGLFFAGELLDIDGLTGGFNFQAAWTTGWLAGQGMAGGLRAASS
jgi:predicted Rossmann fold flavoprotein